MDTSSAFTGSNTENLSCYQQFDVRQVKLFGRGQANVHFDSADNCCLYITTMKAMRFKGDIPSIPIDNFKHHYELVFDLISMQSATESCY